MALRTSISSRFLGSIDEIKSIQKTFYSNSERWEEPRQRLVKKGDVVMYSYEAYSENTALFAIITEDCIMKCRPFGVVVSDMNTVMGVHKICDENWTPAYLTDHVNMQ